MIKGYEEYFCTNQNELNYLISKGFRYTFVKKIQDTKETTIWKFKKTKELYKTIYDYYNENL